MPVSATSDERSRARASTRDAPPTDGSNEREACFAPHRGCTARLRGFAVLFVVR
jgi:hypothetical protein